MSFIHEDKQLVDLLLKYGQAAPQQFFAVSPDDVKAVRGLVANLEQKLTATTGAGAEITSDQAASLTSLNMKNLSSLVNFLGMNGIKVDGKKIVVGSNEAANDPSYVPYRFEGDQNFRPSTQLTFKVNKDLLVKYLTGLQGQLEKNPNPVMQAQVTAIIGEANEQLQTNVSKFYKDPGQTLDAGAVVDSLPKRILTKYQLYGDGPIPLTFGDISSDTGLNSWVQTNGITVDDQPQVDQCGLLKFLYNRAVNKVRNATTQQAKGVANVYQSQLLKLAPAFQCDLTGESKQPGASDQQGQQPGGGAAGAAATLAQLADILPLQRDVLDFGRIRDFINKYRSVATATIDPARLQQISTAMDQAEQYMQAATRNTNGGSQTTFSMDGLTANDLVQWATPPDQGQATRARGSARALADYLEQVVRQVYVIEKDLFNAHYQQFRDPRLSELSMAIQQQVGGPSVPFGSSLASSNMDDIQTARARLPQVGA